MLRNVSYDNSFECRLSLSFCKPSTLVATGQWQAESNKYKMLKNSLVSTNKCKDRIKTLLLHWEGLDNHANCFQIAVFDKLRLRPATNNTIFL